MNQIHLWRPVMMSWLVVSEVLCKGKSGTEGSESSYWWGCYPDGKPGGDVQVFWKTQGKGQSEAMILIPTKGPEDWKHRLADPDLHWKAGYAAYALAHRWEEERVSPAKLKRPWSRFRPLKMLNCSWRSRNIRLVSRRRCGFTERHILPCKESAWPCEHHGWRKSQRTFWTACQRLVSDPSPGKVKRLGFLCRTLGLDPDQVQDVRYQLLHRTASAILEAKRFKALTAACSFIHLAQHTIGLKTMLHSQICLGSIQVWIKSILPEKLMASIFICPGSKGSHVPRTPNSRSCTATSITS